MPVTSIALTVFASAGASQAAPILSGLGAIRLTAERDNLKPDGRSTTIISAQVFDDKGNAVADGTRVRFTTTAGRLDTAVAVTQSGVARVTLTAADQPGEARVVAILESPGQSVPAQININFRAEADNANTGTTWAHFDGSQYVGYIMDFGIIHATGKNGGARLEWKALQVTADTIQFNVKENSFKAVGNVTVTQNGETREYTNLVYAINESKGIGERIEDDAPHLYYVSGSQLEEKPPAEGQFRPPSDIWALEDLSGAGITVVSRSILLEPGTRLQFRRATFYLDGTKMASMPFHVMDLAQASIFRDQVFGLGPQGPMVDFPVYYDVRPEGIGTLHIRHGARLGSLSSSTRPGWSMDVEQAYKRGSADGVLELYGLGRRDWSTRLRHGQRFDKATSGSLYIDFPNHRDLFANTQLSRSFKTFTLNATVSGTRTQGYRDPITNVQGKPGGDIRGQLYGETFDRPVGREQKLRYVFNAGITRQAYYGQAFVGSSGAAQGTIYTESVGTRFFTRALPVVRDTSFTQSLSVGQTFVQGSGVASGVAVQGTSSLTRRLGALGSTTVTYDYTETPALPRLSSYTANPRHRLGYSLSLTTGEPWSIDLFASRGLDISQSTLNSVLQFKIGGPWRGRLAYSASQFSGINYQEQEYGLIRRIAGKDFALYYSTTAKRFQLDLSQASF